MEDLRSHKRTKNFMQIKPQDPKKKSELFMISLRKKKKTEIFATKRKIIMQQFIKESALEIIPESSNLPLDGKIEEIADTFCTVIEESQVLQLLQTMIGIVDNTWSDDYEEIFLTKEMIHRYKSVIKIENISIQRCVVHLVSNIVFHVKSIVPVLILEFKSSGLLNELYELLHLPTNFSNEEFGLALDAIICIANMAYTDKMFIDDIIDSNVYDLLANL